MQAKPVRPDMGMVMPIDERRRGRGTTSANIDIQFQYSLTMCNQTNA
jgi:hypothetical protein